MMPENGTGMDSPLVNESSGALTSREATRKNPSQGKLKSAIPNQRSMVRIDRNKHGIRREVSIQPKKTGRKKV